MLHFSGTKKKKNQIILKHKHIKKQTKRMDHQRKPQQQSSQQQKTKVDEKPSRTLFIRNVQYETPEKEIHDMFSKFGEIRKFFNIVAKRGMAFVTYVSDRKKKKEDELLRFE